MSVGLGFEELNFLFSPPHERSQNGINDNSQTIPANGQLSKKRLQVADLIAANDELVRQVKEFEAQQQQLSSVKRTASEVTELYQQEKKQRIELERRALEDSKRCSELEKQLDVQKLNCEQLEEQAKIKCLPVDAKDMVIIFMQLALRILDDPSSNGLTRAEHNMLRKLKDYCKSANICLPPSKSPTKKRTKISSTTQATSSTQTLDTQILAPSKPEMCSIAVQSESFVTTRDQGIQHKNTTTTRGTTTASFIKMHDVGTCFPEPKPPLNAYQILEKILPWTIAPLSPIIDQSPTPEASPMTSIGTCTELCNVYREIDYLPELPAQLKHSDSRPPSRAMYDSVKDELAPPFDAAALDGNSHHMAKELLSFLPHNQSILAKMPSQVFEEVWQVMGQMVFVALQSSSASSISQADFRSWFDTLYESHQAQNVACSKNISNKETKFMAPADEGSLPDAHTDHIKSPPPKTELDLTPIRLPIKPLFRAMRKPNIKPKKRKLKPCARRQSQAQPKQKEISRPASPTETAVNFLTKLNAFHNPNCDNFDIQLNAEERQLLQLTSATANTKQPPITPIVCEEFAPQSPLLDLSHSMDTQVNDAVEHVSLHIRCAVEDKSHPSHSQPSVKHIVPEQVDSLPADHLLALFGSDSDSEDETNQDRQVAIAEANTDSKSSKSMNSIIVNEEIHNDYVVQHEDIAPNTNLVINNGDFPSDKENLPNVKQPPVKFCAYDRKRKPSTSSSSESQSASSEEESLVINNGDIKLQPVTVPSEKPIRGVSKRIAREAKSAISEESIDSDESVNNISVSNDLQSGTDDHDTSSQVSITADKLALITPVEPQQTANEESDDSDTNSADRNLFIAYADIHSDFVHNDEMSPMSIFIDKLKRETCDESSDSDVDSMDKRLVINDDLHVDSDNEGDKCFQNTIESLPVIIPDDKRMRKASSCSSSDSQSAISEDAIASDADCTDKNLVMEHHDEVKHQNRKRKRNSSMNGSPESQPTEKRLTRSQAKQLLMEADNQDSSNVTDVQLNCIHECSPMSPVDSANCEADDCEPIEIPLDAPDSQNNLSAPKALLSYMINAHKADIKQRSHRKQKPNKKQMDQLHSKIIDYLKLSVPLELTSTQLAAIDDPVLINVLISGYGELSVEAGVKDVLILERLLTMLKQFDCERCSFIEHFMKTLEQRLFNPKDRLSDPMAHKFVKLFLQLIGLQESLTNPVESYSNPARLLLAKILYHYSKQMSLLVLEVLCHFPTVLPHREERDYDHSDPLITVLKHLLMCHQYNVSDPQGPDRALISKLRFEYHFQPFEPTKQQVIENLVEKIKAGRAHQLSYAFALFCRRSIQLNVANLLAEHLMPLANSYCDFCVENEEYDARMESLLQCTSTIVKQLRLDGQSDITGYIALFKRILVAVPRPGVQEAAVQAILRMQRFGYAFVVEALQSYRPDHQLTSLTRAMLRTFVERRQQYLLASRV
ncbi:little elongation complex subunit 1 [Drosophila hydei]|uniref:Little elongation complex subunit 1 n=1 Tax=Drosophila hydei TaxID=7224 RepID=A0A6J1MEI8_DROHY|nr:little elongation complex subunit 1 [Drosophila hydei]